MKRVSLLVVALVLLISGCASHGSYRSSGTYYVPTPSYHYHGWRPYYPRHYHRRW